MKRLSPFRIREKLKSSLRDRSEIEEAYVPLRTDSERQVAESWRKVLKIDRIGREDSFFGLGGDSLQMAEVIVAIRKRFGVRLTPRVFLRSPTLSLFAAAVFPDASGVSKSGAENGVANIVIPDVDAEGRLADFPSSYRSEIDSARVAIPTCDRPAALERCLRFLRENLERYERDERIFIVDGSTDSSLAKQNAEIARRYGKRTVLSYVGEGERREIIRRFVVNGFDSETVEFALRGAPESELGSIGANRNLLTLLSAGSAFASLNDDTVAVFARSPESGESDRNRPVLRFENEGDIEHVFAANDRAQLFEGALFENIDFVGSHLQFLGKTLSQVIRGAGPGVVRLTIGGLIGDCGWGSPSRYLTINDESFENATRNPERYGDSVTSREVLRVASRYALCSHSRSLMTTAFGGDGRSILPPFYTSGRGSDEIFGMLASMVYPDTVFAHLPWAIVHMPVERRRFSKGEILRDAGSSDIRELFAGIISSLSISNAKSVSDRYCALGGALSALGDLSDEAYLECIGENRRIACVEKAAFLEDRLERFPDLPAAALHDVEAYRNRLMESAGDARKALPAEFRSESDFLEGLRQSRALVARYGRLLRIWPEMYRFALREEMDGRPSRSGDLAGPGNR